MGRRQRKRPCSPLDLYEYAGFYWHTLFQSLDGFEVVAVAGDTAQIDLDGIRLLIRTRIPPAINDEVYVTKMPDHRYTTVPLTWLEPRRFKTTIQPEWTVNQVIYVTMGAAGQGIGTTLRHVGFKIVNNGLYASVADGAVENNALIETFALGTIWLLEARFLPGVRADFFVDGVHRAYLTANLPAADDNTSETVIMFADVCTTEAVDHSIWLSEWFFLQEP